MDPLKPFSSSIRLLWERAAKRADESTPPAPIQKRTDAVAEPKSPDDSVKGEARLRSRLLGLRTWDSARARAFFVEQVVLDEMGADLETDPAFQKLVQRVSEQLGADAALSGRLDQLLRQTRDEAARA
jgi:hypothetical protein